MINSVELSWVYKCVADAGLYVGAGATVGQNLDSQPHPSGSKSADDAIAIPSEDLS